MLRNIERYKGFCGRLGLNDEPLYMSVEANLAGDQFVFNIKVPGHVFENIQTKAFEEALLHDVPLPSVSGDV